MGRHIGYGSLRVQHGVQVNDRPPQHHAEILQSSAGCCVPKKGTISTDVLFRRERCDTDAKESTCVISLSSLVDGVRYIRIYSTEKPHAQRTPRSRDRSNGCKVPEM